MARYYDIHEIMMEDERISVGFQVGANGVGMLDPSSETNNIETGARVELPAWLAHDLLLRQAVSVSLPACFGQKTRKEIQADADSVDLMNKSPYFYELGCKISPMVGDRSLGSFLRYAFTGRYKQMLSKSHSTAAAGTTPKFSTCLTKEETQLYEAARYSMDDLKKWRMGGPRLQRATILGRKRKTSILNDQVPT